MNKKGVFFRFLKRSNTRLKSLLIGLLGRTGNKDAVPLAVTILEDEFFTVRADAAKALGELNDTRAITPLLRAQKSDPSEEVQREAALALKRLDANQ